MCLLKKILCLCHPKDSPAAASLSGFHVGFYKEKEQEPEMLLNYELNKKTQHAQWNLKILYFSIINV